MSKSSLSDIHRASILAKLDAERQQRREHIVTGKTTPFRVENEWEEREERNEEEDNPQDIVFSPGMDFDGRWVENIWVKEQRVVVSPLLSPSPFRSLISPSYPSRILLVLHRLKQSPPKQRPQMSEIC